METILIIANSKRNVLLLKEFLDAKYRIITDASRLERNSYDMVIIDGPMLEQYRQQIEAMKNRTPEIFNPVLLMTGRKHVGFATQHLWTTIDEIIITPIEKIELLARIENLLKARRLSKEFNHLLIQVSPLGIMVLDQNGSIIQWNPACYELLGWSEAEAVGNVFPFVYERDLKIMRQLLSRVLGGEIILDVELQFRRKGGTPIYVSLNATALIRTEKKSLALFIIEDIHERKEYEEKIFQQTKAIEKAYDDTILSLSETLDLRDRETAGHCTRVMRVALEIGKRMNLPADQMVQLRRGALLHDFGKIGIPDEIMLKPGPLTDDEWVIMKQHPEIAYQKLSHIEYLRSALEVPYCHHERWDGKGYPRGLKAKEIPLLARIFSVSDVFDALTSNRPYRAAWTQDSAIHYIESQAGLMFDPEVVKVFLAYIRERDI